MKKSTTTIQFAILILFLIGIGEAKAQTKLLPREDTYFQNNGKNNDFGSNSTLAIKGASNASGVLRIAYLKFDVIPKKLKSIKSGILKLYCTGGEKTNPETPVTISVYSIDNTNWTEKSLINNTSRPDVAAAAAVPIFISSTVVGAQGNFYEWDVKEYLKNLDSHATSITLMLKVASKSDTYGFQKRFVTRENGTTKKRPTLVFK